MFPQGNEIEIFSREKIAPKSAEVDVNQNVF